MVISKQRSVDGYEFPVWYSHKVIGYGIGPQKDSEAKETLPISLILNLFTPMFQLQCITTQQTNKGCKISFNKKYDFQIKHVNASLGCDNLVRANSQILGRCNSWECLGQTNLGPVNSSPSEGSNKKSFHCIQSVACYLDCDTSSGLSDLKWFVVSNPGCCIFKTGSWDLIQIVASYQVCCILTGLLFLIQIVGCYPNSCTFPGLLYLIRIVASHLDCCILFVCLLDHPPSPTNYYPTASYHQAHQQHLSKAEWKCETVSDWPNDWPTD